MRTRLGICKRKRAFDAEKEAFAAAQTTGFVLRSYRCDRCRRFHLTSRTKGKRIPRPEN